MANRKHLIIVVIIAAVAITLVSWRTYSAQSTNPSQTTPIPSTNTNPVESSEIVITSTSPSPLEGAILLPGQNIEITFNQKVEIPESFNTRIDEWKDYEIKLSPDHKTAIVIPTKPFKPGQGYTLYILPDSKFEGGKPLGKEYYFHFRPIQHQGL